MEIDECDNQRFGSGSGSGCGTFWVEAEVEAIFENHLEVEAEAAEAALFGWRRKWKRFLKITWKQKWKRKHL